MPCLPPPPSTETEIVTFPRPTRGDLELASVTEVTERAMYAMYDAMRGAAVGAQRTGVGRRRK